MDVEEQYEPGYSWLEGTPNVSSGPTEDLRDLIEGQLREIEQARRQVGYKRRT